MNFIGSIFRFFILPLLVLWLIAFTIYNPALVAINLWPLPYEIAAPQSVLVILLLAVGFIAGCLRNYAKLLNLRAENASQKRQLDKLEKEIIPKV